MRKFSSFFGHKPPWVGLLLLLSLQQSAWADVWGFIDSKGMAHFAADRVDARYELFYKGGESFDSRDGVPVAPEPTPGTPRPVAVPTARPKLLAFFDVSPSYKAVKHHLREAARQHDIDYELLQALIATESGFDAAAVSPKGAVGLMQLMPATAQRYGVAADRKTTLAQKLTDPRTNIRAGSRYLSDLIQLFPGQIELALAAYNAGEGAVQRAGNQIPNFRETQNYVKTVMQLYQVLKPPAAVAAASATRRQSPARVRIELPTRPGGALGRGNMPPPVQAPRPTPQE